MDLVVEPEAERDLKQFDTEYQSYILKRLKELEENPASHEGCDTIQVKGRPVFKYVMKQGSRGGKDFRAIYDILDSEIRVIAIFHRDKGYDKEEISERF